MVIDLKGSAARFMAMVGLDDEKIGSPGTITFEVWADGKKVFSTPVMRGGQEPRLVSIDLTGAKRLALRVGDADDGIDSDHADWAGAVLILTPGTTEKPEAIVPPPIPVVPPRMTIPAPDPKPALHGPRITGA